MKLNPSDIKLAYPDWEEGYGPGDYEPLLLSLVPGGEKLLQVDVPDYQGDSWVLFKAPGTIEIGYLQFGWGSCSGCDALQACRTWVDLKSLQEDLARDIVWFDTPKDALTWLRARDWDGCCPYGSNQDLDKFLKKANEVLGGAT